MRNVKYTISFLSNDQKLLQFVEEKRRTQNFSAYIRNLIRNDMESSENPDFEDIYKYVVRRIKEDGYMIDGNGMSTQNCTYFLRKVIDSRSFILKHLFPYT